MKKGSPWMRPGPAENVSIPAPPGHRRAIEQLGVDLIRINCLCGWRSLALSPVEAEKSYDRHIADLGSWCDFCGGLWPLPVEFKCRDFSLDFGTVDENGDPQVFVYNGNWCACAPCAQLVLVGDWRKLAERAIEMTIEMETGRPFEPRFRTSPGYRRSVAKVRLLHSAFRRHREGL